MKPSQKQRRCDWGKSGGERVTVAEVRVKVWLGREWGRVVDSLARVRVTDARLWLGLHGVDKELPCVQELVRGVHKLLDELGPAVAGGQTL